ncbi:kinase [Alkalihalobacillus sp. CinArs1]|uniref:kinase n=1 Tax=Alkalihalobacillus sp. CinArs1 TaxID=2995314 RepID=UPI0022DE3F89|nr:kinase [Alkalihalobacillus sp. CinArs1]
MKEVMDDILSKFPKQNRVVVGIDGLSRSGKTTLVNNMCERVTEREVIVIHIDDFIVSRNKRYGTGYEEWFEYYYLQWDVSYLRDHLFDKVKQTSELTLQRYDEKSDTHTSYVQLIPENALVLIEGVFIQREEWRGYLEYVIYLECSRRARFERESEETKKNLKKFYNRYWKAEDYYFEKVDPVLHADFVLDNGTSPSK